MVCLAPCVALAANTNPPATFSWPPCSAWRTPSAALYTVVHLDTYGRHGARSFFTTNFIDRLSKECQTKYKPELIRSHQWARFRLKNPPNF
jgi:hypothetical protein